MPHVYYTVVSPDPADDARLTIEVESGPGQQAPEVERILYGSELGPRIISFDHERRRVTLAGQGGERLNHPPLSTRLKFLAGQAKRAYGNAHKSEAAGLEWLAAGKAFDEAARAEGWNSGQVRKFMIENG